VTRTGSTVGQEAGAAVVVPGVLPAVEPGTGVAEPGLTDPLTEGEALPGEFAVTDPTVAAGVGVALPRVPPEQPVSISALARSTMPRHRCAGFMPEA
jgi:hypothetical protein